MSDETAAVLRQILIDELSSVRTDVREILVHQQEAGMLIGALSARVTGLETRCMGRATKCSAEFRKLGSTLRTVEDTGVHHLAELNGRRKARRELIKTVAIIVSTAAAMMALMTGWGALRCHTRGDAPPKDAAQMGTTR